MREGTGGGLGLSGSATLRRLLGGLPAGVLPVAVGLAVLGLTSYGFLIVAARGLAPAPFAQLSIVWTALFTIGPGLFLPMEQAVAQRLASGAEPVLLVRRAAIFAAGLAVLLSLISVLLFPIVTRRLLDSNGSLFWIMVLANCALAPVHLSRGVLAGSGQFAGYGRQLGADGCLRLLGAAALAIGGVHSATAYASVLVFSQLIAVLVSVVQARWPHQPVHGDGHDAPTPSTWLSLGRSLGWMLVGTLMAQILANAGTAVVKAFAKPGDAAAGQFLTAVVLTRLPLFLFAALQASLLPGLARRISGGDLAGAAGGIKRLFVLLAGLGAVASITLLLAGPELNSLLFGPDFRVSRSALVILSLASTAYMLAAAAAQALLALESAARVAAGWIVGTIAFFTALALPGNLEIRVSLALLIGTVLTTTAFMIAVRHGFAARAVRQSARRGAQS